MIGIEPGETSTRSATLNPCDFEIAEVTSRFTKPSRSAASSSDSSFFLSSIMATSFSAPCSETAIAAQRRTDRLNRRLDIVGRVVAPVHDQEVLDAPHDEQLTLGEETRISRPQPWSCGCAFGGLTIVALKVRSVASGFCQ